MPNKYETVFILTPVLSDDQAKEAVGKFRKILKDLGANILHEESWGLRKLAYTVEKRSTGYYQLFEYTANAGAVADLELSFKRDERVLRFMTVRLDRYAARADALTRFNEGIARQDAEAEGGSKSSVKSAPKPAGTSAKGRPARPSKAGAKTAKARKTKAR